MAEKVADLSIVIRAKNAARTVLSGINNQIKGLSEAAKRWETQLRLVRRAFLAIATVSIGLFVGAVNQAAGFEQAIANVGAVSKASKEDMDRLSKAALEMGSTSVFSSSQAAEAQLFLAQAGQDTTQIIESLSGVMSLAAATGEALGFAAETTTATLSQFSLAASEADRVANLFAASSSASQANLGKLSFALRQVGPVANAVGFSLESTVAALNLLFNAGFKGEQAGTILRGALSNLLKPSKEAADLIEKLGVQILDSSGKMRPFIEILREFERVNLDATQAVTIFGTEAGPGLLALLGQGTKALAEMETKITGTTEAQRQAEARTKTFQGAITQLKSAIEGLAISIGSEFIPGLTDVTQKIKEFVEQVSLKRAFEVKKNAETIEGAFLRIKEEITELDTFISKFDQDGFAGKLDRLIFGDDPLAQAKQRRDGLLLIRKAIEEFASAEVAADRHTQALSQSFQQLQKNIADPNLPKSVAEVKKQIQQVTELIASAQKEVGQSLALGDSTRADIKSNVIAQAKAQLKDLEKTLIELQSPNLNLQGLPIVAANAWREYSEALNEVNRAQLQVLQGEQALLADELSAAEKKLAAIRRVEDIQNRLEEFNAKIRDQGLTEEQRNIQTLSDAWDKFRRAGLLQGEERVKLLNESANASESVAQAFKAGSLESSEAIGVFRLALESLSQEAVKTEKLDPFKNIKEQKQEVLNTIKGIKEKFEDLKKNIASLDAVVKIVDQDKLIADAEKLKNQLLVKFSTPIEQTIIVKQKEAKSDGFAGFTSGPAQFRPGQADSKGSGVAVPGSGLPKSSIPIRSFATGIRVVPRDMIAQLHEGERVLTARENREIKSGGLGAASISFGDIVVQVGSSAEAPEVTARRIHEELKRIDERKSV